MFSKGGPKLSLMVLQLNVIKGIGHITTQMCLFCCVCMQEYRHCCQKHFYDCINWQLLIIILLSLLSGEFGIFFFSFFFFFWKDKLFIDSPKWNWAPKGITAVTWLHQIISWLKRHFKIKNGTSIFAGKVERRQWRMLLSQSSCGWHWLGYLFVLKSYSPKRTHAGIIYFSLKSHSVTLYIQLLTHTVLSSQVCLLLWQ